MKQTVWSVWMQVAEAQVVTHHQHITHRLIMEFTTQWPCMQVAEMQGRAVEAGGARGAHHCLVQQTWGSVWLPRGLPPPVGTGSASQDVL